MYLKCALQLRASLSAHVRVYNVFSWSLKKDVNYKVPVVNIWLYWLVTGTVSELSCLVLQYRDHYTLLGSTQTTSPRSKLLDQCMSNLSSQVLVYQQINITQRRGTLRYIRNHKTVEKKSKNSFQIDWRGRLKRNWNPNKKNRKPHQIPDPKYHWYFLRKPITKCLFKNRQFGNCNEHQNHKVSLSLILPAMHNNARHSLENSRMLKSSSEVYASTLSQYTNLKKLDPLLFGKELVFSHQGWLSSNTLHSCWAIVRVNNLDYSYHNSTQDWKHPFHFCVRKCYEWASSTCKIWQAYVNRAWKLIMLPLSKHYSIERYFLILHGR